MGANRLVFCDGGNDECTGAWRATCGKRLGWPPCLVVELLHVGELHAPWVDAVVDRDSLVDRGGTSSRGTRTCAASTDRVRGSRVRVSPSHRGRRRVADAKRSRAGQCCRRREGSFFGISRTLDAVAVLSGGSQRNSWANSNHTVRSPPYVNIIRIHMRKGVSVRVEVGDERQ